MNSTWVSWPHQVLFKLLNTYSQFLSFSYRIWNHQSEDQHPSQLTLPWLCSKCFARNTSCILTEETNTSYSTYSKGFTWVRQRMAKKSRQRCDPAPQFTVERIEAKEGTGFREERSALSLWRNGFTFLGSCQAFSSLPSISGSSFCPTQNEHSWEHACDKCDKCVPCRLG